MDAEGNQVPTYQPLLAATTFKGPVDFRQGPDGPLYITNYGFDVFGTSASTSIARISYKGACRPTEVKLERPVGMAGIELFDTRGEANAYGAPWICGRARRTACPPLWAWAR